MKTNPSPLPRVSFIVPVRNDAVRLERCLKSIAATSYPQSHREILVIDNGSTDGSASVALRLGARVTSMSGGNVAQLRNHGATAATGDVLAFVDADNEVTRGWVRSAVETLQCPGVAATGALYSAPEDGTWVQRAYGVLRGRPKGTHDVEWLGSGNLAVVRSAFEAVGPFDTGLDTCEDVDLCNRLRAAGFRIVSDARLKNIHHGDPRTLWELFRGELWRGRDNLRVSLRGPLTWRALPSTLIPILDLLMLPVMFAGASLAIYGWFNGIMVALAASIAILFPACLRAARSALNSGEASVKNVIATFAVVCVYDMGRALALIARMSHHRKPPAVEALP